jgi:excisionase family DNA binding protein
MRSRLTAVPAGRAGQLMALFEQLEAGAGALSSGEVLDAIGRAGRLEALLRARYATLAAPAPALMAAQDGARYLDAAAAADYIGVSKSTVFRLARAGRLPLRRPSEGTVRFDRQDLDAYMSSEKMP